MDQNIRRTVCSKESEQASFPNTHIPKFSINFGRTFSPFFNLINLQDKTLISTVPTLITNKLLIGVLSTKDIHLVVIDLDRKSVLKNLNLISNIFGISSYQGPLIRQRIINLDHLVYVVKLI